MTLRRMVEEMYEADAEVPDLEYRDAAGAVDTASNGWSKLVALVNEGQNAIATWVHQDGRRMRMRLTDDVARLVALQQTLAIDSVGSGSLVLTTASGARDTYRKCRVEGATSGATALVFASYSDLGGDTLLLSETEGTFVAGESLVASRRDYYFADTSAETPPFADGRIYTDYTYGRPVEITGVLQTDGTELELKASNNKLTSIGTTNGQPSSYTKTALGLHFDVFPDEAYTYYVRFARLPRPLSVLDAESECELPQQFHRAVVLYGLWWLLLREHETDKAYAVRRNLEDMLKRTQTEFDMQDREQRGQIKLDMEG